MNLFWYIDVMWLAIMSEDQSRNLGRLNKWIKAPMHGLMSVSHLHSMRLM